MKCDTIPRKYAYCPFFSQANVKGKSQGCQTVPFLFWFDGEEVVQDWACLPKITLHSFHACCGVPYRKSVQNTIVISTWHGYIHSSTYTASRAAAKTAEEVPGAWILHRLSAAMSGS